MIAFIVATFVTIILIFIWCACKINSEISRLEEEKEMLENEQNENSRK